MEGPDILSEQRGITPRCFQAIFQYIGTTKNAVCAYVWTCGRVRVFLMYMVRRVNWVMSETIVMVAYV